MNNDLRKRFPSHAGLNADWSVRAWRIGHAADRELWLLEDEESFDNSFEVVERVWSKDDDCWQCELLRSGLTDADAAVLLGVK